MTNPVTLKSGLQPSVNPIPNPPPGIIARYIQQLGWQNAQLTFEKNQEVNKTRQDAIQKEKQWRAVIEKSDQQLKKLEEELEKLTQEQKASLEFQKIQEQELAAQQKQIAGFHQVLKNAEEQVIYLQTEIGRLKEQNNKLQNLKIEVENQLDHQKRIHLELREQFQRQLTEIQRAERERANQAILDEKRYDDYKRRIQSIKVEYDNEAMKVLSIASTLPAISAFFAGPIGFFFGSVALAMRITTPSQEMCRLKKEMIQLKNPFLVLSQRLGKPLIHSTVFDLNQNLALL